MNPPLNRKRVAGNPLHTARAPVLDPTAPDAWQIAQLGIEINQATVAKYLVRRRGTPAPTWRSLLRNQAAGITAIDMFVMVSASFRRLYVRKIDSRLAPFKCQFMQCFKLRSAGILGKDRGFSRLIIAT